MERNDVSQSPYKMLTRLTEKALLGAIPPQMSCKVIPNLLLEILECTYGFPLESTRAVVP